MSSFLARLARASVLDWKRRALVLCVLLVAFGGLVVALKGETSNDFAVPGSDAQAATDLLTERFPQAAGDTATVVFSADRGAIAEGANAAAIRRVVEEVSRQPGVTGVTDPTSREGAAQVSEDGRIAFADVQYGEPASELGKEPYERLEAATAELGAPGLTAALRGPIVDEGAAGEHGIGEVLGIAVAIIVLTLVFRSVAAMALTLVVSLLCVAIALGFVFIGARFVGFSTFAPTLALMLGLGAGIDYSLLIIARYRENLARGQAPADAAARANATAGVSVLTAGAIVIVAITGLLVTGIPFVGKLGLSTGIAVATVAVGAVTLLPVAVGALGRRLVPPPGTSSEPPAALTRWGAMLVRRRWVVIPVTTLVLGALAFQFSDLRLGTPDDSTRAEKTTQRVAYDQLSRGFGVGSNGPIVIAAAIPADARNAEGALERLRAAASRDAGVASASPAVLSQRGDAAILQVIPRTSPQDARTSELIERLRADVVPAATRGAGLDVHVGGFTATQEDLADRIASRLPIFICVVVLVAVLLLMAAFRSVLVPLVSAAFNVLSVLAAYGLTVLVFQKGAGGSLIGVEESIPIVSFVPLFMFALLFGLSMDYNVFQQSRIREEHERGRGAHEAVIVGFAATGKVIAAAGAIMVAVFGAFMLTDDITTKVIGFGLASAILIDVVLVRYLLAPAVIAALGERAWSLPGWMDRLLPNLALEGREVDDGEEGLEDDDPRTGARAGERPPVAAGT